MFIFHKFSNTLNKITDFIIFGFLFIKENAFDFFINYKINIINLLLIALSLLRIKFTYIMKYFNRYKVIVDSNSNKPYLERYVFPFNIFLHRIINSDLNNLHDHPWNFRTLVLLGGYWDCTEEGKVWIGPFNYKYYDAESFHRIELDKKTNYCWALIFPSKKIKDWGFKTKEGFIQHDIFLKKSKKNKYKRYFSKKHKRPYYKKIF